MTVMVDEQAELRAVFASVPTSVAAIGAKVGVGVGAEPVIMVTSSFTVGVSYSPPMVSVAVQHSSSTWPLLASAERLGVSVLGMGLAGAMRQLGSRNRASRLDGLAWGIAPGGALFLDDTPVWFECTVEHVYPAGDHDIVVMRVIRHVRGDDSTPLVWAS